MAVSEAQDPLQLTLDFSQGSPRTERQPTEPSASSVALAASDAQNRADEKEAEEAR